MNIKNIFQQLKKPAPGYYYRGDKDIGKFRLFDSGQVLRGYIEVISGVWHYFIYQVGPVLSGSEDAPVALRGTSVSLVSCAEELAKRYSDYRIQKYIESAELHRWEYYECHYESEAIDDISYDCCDQWTDQIIGRYFTVIRDSMKIIEAEAFNPVSGRYTMQGEYQDAAAAKKAIQIAGDFVNTSDLPFIFNDLHIRYAPGLGYSAEFVNELEEYAHQKAEE